MSTNFESLWDEFSTPLKTYIKHHVNNDEDVEDLLQTVFFKINSKIDSIIDVKKIHSWVYTIARNTIYDYYRAQKHDLYIEDLAEYKFCNPKEEDLLNNDIARCLQSMIQYLPEKYKQALILTEYQNLTQKELSIQLGISLSGAKSRVQRARVLLKEMILNCCSIEQDCRGNIIDYKHKKGNCKHC